MVSKQVASIKKALKELKKNGYKVGKPRIKDRDEYNSFTYNQSGYRLVKRDDKWYLWLSKIGYIKIKLHRMIYGNIKQVTIKRKNDKWYAIFTIERLYPIFKFINTSKIVGIDLGIKHFIVNSNGNKVEKIEDDNRLLRRLKLTQRKISRRIKGSNNYNKAKKWYQVIHERIMNKRRDFLHKTSNEYSKKYDIIVEDLNTKKMLNNKPLDTNKQNNRLHRNIVSNSFAQFIDMLKYKAKLLIRVNPKDTTQLCYRCGNRVDKSLSDRIHKCECGIKIDRDYNSALNILKKGLEYLPMERGEVTPVEILNGSRKQEAYGFSHR